MKNCRLKVSPLDPAAVSSVDELCRSLAGGGFQGRKLSKVVDIWVDMCRDDCFKVLTLAGAMVPAGMAEVLSRLIEAKAVDVIVSTGANVTHDFVNAVVGQAHYLGSEHADDDELRAERTNRIYDIYIPEEHYEQTESFLLDVLRSEGIKERRFSTAEFTRFLGEHVPENARSLLSVAAKHDVPIFVPAISDSELGLAAAVYRRRDGIRIDFDEVGDIDRYAKLIEANPRSGCVVVGGGVPRNWAQQVFPYLDVLHRSSGRPLESGFSGFTYGVRFSTDRPEFGGLSGCTFEESKSWGKYTAEARFESVTCDATIALPVAATALLQRLGR